MLYIFYAYIYILMISLIPIELNNIYAVAIYTSKYRRNISIQFINFVANTLFTPEYIKGTKCTGTNCSVLLMYCPGSHERVH